MSSATTVREAVWLEQDGADVVIAQGYEAGGHRGCFLNEPHDEHDLASQPGTFALVPQVAAAVAVPVVAAGGIADAAGVRAALALGASGVQVGTSYLCCDEALTSALHRTALLSPEPQTVVTNVFTGRPARGIVNRFVCELGPLSTDVPVFPLATAASAPLRAAAEARGTSDFTPLWSGQNRTGCRRAPAAEVTLDLLQGFIGPV
jgi:nitronate monooxygenase